MLKPAYVAGSNGSSASGDPGGRRKRDLRFLPCAPPAGSSKRLAAQDVQRFNEQGFLSPLDVFTTSEVSKYRDYFDELLRCAALAGWGSYDLNAWHVHCGGIWDLATHPRILDLVEGLLGPNLLCIATHLFVKMPHDGKRVSWHQDAPYWPWTPSRAVTVWLAIDDVTPDNGPMTFIPRSHVHGAIRWRASVPEEQSVLQLTVDNPSRWGGPPVAITLRAGQASLHTDLLLHGSEPNLSSGRRCGLTLRYIPPEVRLVSPVPHGTAILCRGTDPSGYWQHISRPPNDSVPQKKARHGAPQWNPPFPRPSVSTVDSRKDTGASSAVAVGTERRARL